MHATTWLSHDKKEEMVVCALKDLDTGATRLDMVHNPLRRIGVTKEALRIGVNTKKLYEYESNLDIRVIPNWDVPANLKEMVYGKNPRQYRGYWNMVNSPFVYGVDIDMSVLIRQHHYNKHKTLCSGYRVGALDIEVDVARAKLYPAATPMKTIIVTNYTSPELVTYSAVLKGFVKGHTHEELVQEISSSFTKFKSGVFDSVAEILDKHEPKFILKVFNTELELLKWTFSNINNNKPDYVSIWNLDYDIPRIMDRIRALGGDVLDIIPHPDVPRKYAKCIYSCGTHAGLAHFTYAWHTLDVSGYSTYYDSMCLYSRLRKHKGMLDSYSLDAISKKHLGDGKRAFEEAGHYEMQTDRQVEYCGYAAIDTIICVLLDKVLDDVVTMNALIPYSDFPSFAQQTVQLKHRFHDYCKQRGMMSASQMGTKVHPTDKHIQNVGGNVLPPALAWRTGVNRIKELVNVCRKVVSKLVLLVVDLDVTFNLKKSFGVA